MYTSTTQATESEDTDLTSFTLSQQHFLLMKSEKHFLVNPMTYCRPFIQLVIVNFGFF